MFDRLSDRIATAVVTGLDVAVEFATLGEYRLAVPPSPGASAPPAPRPLVPARVFDGSSLFTFPEGAALPRPATAVVRAAVTAPTTPAVMAICSNQRTRATPQAHAVGRPRPRARGGAVKGPEQLCLWPPS